MKYFTLEIILNIYHSVAKNIFYSFDAIRNKRLAIIFFS